MGSPLFDTLCVELGLPACVLREKLGYREERCECLDPRCMGVRAAFELRAHVVQGKSGGAELEVLKSDKDAPRIVR